MLNTERCVPRTPYLQRIDSLHKSKMAMNAQKIRLIGRGKMDFDDWGFVHYPDFSFSYASERDDGIICGPLPIGRALRAFLEAIPRYVHPDSALAGAWIGAISNWVNIRMDPKDRPMELVPVWETYDTRPGFGGMNHCAPDMAIGLALGWGGLLEKIRHYRALNNPVDTGFYDGEEQVVLGMRTWVGDLAREARRMAAEEDVSQETAGNLLAMADMNDWLVDNPPRSFREACQFLAHFQSLDRTYYVGGALQQLDELLRPYYERDVANGELDDGQAVWMLASLFFNDTHYSQIAGLTPDGSRDMTSRLSFLVLDAMHLLKIPANIALRVHDGVHPELLRRSLEYTVEDGTGVDYSLNVGCEQGYANAGFPMGLARLRAKVGCNWTALPGREYPLQDVTRANLAFALHHALNDVRAMPSQEWGLETIFERFNHHVRVIVDSIKAGYDRHYEVVGRNTPELVYNLFMHGPIERGLNCSEGGVDILNFNIDGVGLATVADSLAAIERRVVKEKRLSFEELFRLMEANWSGAEDMRLMMRNIERFGSPGSRAEAWALRVRDVFVEACRCAGTPKHHLPVIPGMFSHGTIKDLGAKLPATPNGRFAGEAISHSNEPDPGFARGVDSFSPSLKATAVAKAQPGFGNSAPLHLDIDADMVRTEAGMDALVALIHTHNRMGGTLINLNCLTKERLEAAHENPDQYPDLLVRVTGYSAFFASLSREYRQQILDRFLTQAG
jgi:pyruvate-formate lyase